MDELELRIAALETAWIETMGLVDAGALADAAQALRDRAAEDLDGEERVIRLAAAQLCDDAARRWPFG